MHGCWDHGPRERLDTVLTEDAVCDYMTVIVEGLPAIVEKVTNALGPLDASQHIISNQQVTIDGDTATCRCYLHAQHTLRGTEGGDNFIIAGRYDDELVRTPDGGVSHSEINKRLDRSCNPGVRRPS